MKNKQEEKELLSNGSETELDYESNQEVWEEVDSLEKETIVKESKSKTKNKKDKQIKAKTKKTNGFKKLFFGVGKEFERVTWTTKKELASSFLITLVVVAFFAIIFTVISLLITGAKL
ncbi:preprotein translocase subunit SecE [Malacoplasma penetrans]|uniref:preprotein translocase subunit SecE n=1 Tax=Malacoplasma penetrans TaxID=28227 RepID=UPI001010BFBC|nr:preprotein translocase subunit SecE [Malacoplasma penetrans]RXY97089.1 preprotein translocase subunit SecE [Malacoplasma penetrans]